MSQTKVKSGLLNFPDQTDFVKLPSGTTAQRPSSPEEGYSRYNTTDNKLEFWTGTIWQQLPGVVAPIITSISYPGDDLAADPAGGQTITITGTDFKAGATVTVDGTTPSVITFVSATEITFTAPAKTAGDYDIVVTNVDGGNATAVDGMTYNGLPSWTTPAGNLGTFEENTTIPTITLVAAEPDSGLISYSITTGGLPTGLSLTGADIDGTTPSVAGETTYNFTVTATDNENQSTERNFNIVVYKLVPSFNTVLYSGSSSTQSITGVGFQPDFLWIKGRNTARDYFFTKYAGVYKWGSFTDSAAWEDVSTNFTSFDSDGFTLGNNFGSNYSGINYVAWCWKAGGFNDIFNLVENNSQSYSSSAASLGIPAGSFTTGWRVSANRDLGFSIVNYGPGAGTGATIGHGLGKKPDLIILQSTGGGETFAYASNIGAGKFLRTYQLSAAETSNIIWNGVEPTNDVFSLGSYGNVSGSGNYNAFCFSSVSGISKFGSYTGNLSSQTDIDLGFEPSFVIIKCTSGFNSGDWVLYHKYGPTSNPKINPLLIRNFSEQNALLFGINFTSNGFNIPTTCTTNSVNQTGYTYMYMAFANQF